jgi:hypothetical protein
LLGAPPILLTMRHCRSSLGAGCWGSAIAAFARTRAPAPYGFGSLPNLWRVQPFLALLPLGLRDSRFRFPWSCPAPRLHGDPRACITLRRQSCRKVDQTSLQARLNGPQLERKAAERTGAAANRTDSALFWGTRPIQPRWIDEEIHPCMYKKLRSARPRSVPGRLRRSRATRGTRADDKTANPSSALSLRPGRPRIAGCPPADAHHGEYGQAPHAPVWRMRS